MKHLLSLFLLAASVNAMSQLQAVSSGAYHWNNLPVKKDAQRESRKIMEGLTPEFEYFEVHATTQYKGAVPRPAHTQKDREELIIIKEGSMKCTIGDKTAVLGKGSVILIPPQQLQTLENVGDGPLTYYVFMFRSKKGMDMERSNKAGGALVVNYDSVPYTEKAGKGRRVFFDRATAMCENVEMHITTLKQKGPSHAPHQHVDSEMMVVIEGETEMMIEGKQYTARAGDLYFAESGKMHGISNSSSTPCSYYAIRWR